MQDPSTYQQIQPQFPEHEHLKCPRCDSTNTKFCYYNNYNLSQPRHYCKNCRRYWTKGGALRNIPVGGGSRKNTKRASNNPKRPAPKPEPSGAYGQGLGPGSGSPSGFNQDRRILDAGGSFSSLLNGQFGNLLNGSAAGHLGEFGENPDSNSDPGLTRNPEMELHSSDNTESLLGDSSCWGNVGGGNGWPNLSIYTPGSTFQ